MHMPKSVVHASKFSTHTQTKHGWKHEEKEH